MGRLVLHALVHGIAPPLSLNPAVYACALGSALATPTDFGAHDYSWLSGTAGKGAMASCGWVGWGEQRYEAHLRWLDASDPSGHSHHHLNLQMLQLRGRGPVCQGAAREHHRRCAMVRASSVPPSSCVLACAAGFC